MEAIIPPIPTKKLLDELNEERFFRKTNNARNEIYIISSKNSPNVMQEIGRLREITFREAGGGTGLPVDIDHYDFGDNPFEQLIVWNPEDQSIVGGYRFKYCKGLPLDENGQVDTPSSELFHYTEKFVNEYLPYTIELGRSFVQPAYQPTKNIRKGLFSLDNLWDGLGALLNKYPETKYFFGKVTMYPNFDVKARDMILYFLEKYFPDNDNMVYPKIALQLETKSEELENLFTKGSYEENYKILRQKVREHSENIPPLVNAYMNLSPTMISFGTSLNPLFGNVEETAVIVTVGDIYNEKIQRHLIYEKEEKPSHLQIK
ncbi:MAG: GNAT family N-acetyltransferase [Lentimicrobiaceae bacterium]|jgi:hypothetical protein|nr:GNAT family N-acetyltransferase [Lentimicrobiaceae bacterium]